MILVGCEKSGIVRDAFTRHGYDATSCDLVPSAATGKHIIDDVVRVLRRGWRLAILHPECRKVCVSGNHKYAKGKPGWGERLAAARWIEHVWETAIAHCDYVALENSMGTLSTLTGMGKPAQIIQPYNFGHDASKATCLWLHRLPGLADTKRIPGRQVIYKGKQVERWANQTDSGQNRLGPSPTRSADRANTYYGVRDAMADQWGRWLDITGEE